MTGGRAPGQKGVEKTVSMTGLDRGVHSDRISAHQEISSHNMWIKYAWSKTDGKKKMPGSKFAEMMKAASDITVAVCRSLQVCSPGLPSCS